MSEISPSHEELLLLYKEKGTRELEEIAYSKASEYSEDALSAISEILKKRSDRIIGITHKYCQICKRINDLKNKICPCGYNFEKTNIEEINLVRKKRSKSNRILGIVMIFCGIMNILIFRGDNQIHSFMTGIGGFAVLIGIYKFFTGKTVKKPTKSAFDSVLGDTEESKDIKDDISYTICSSCKKQILLELNSKNCPNCGAKIQESKD